MAIIRPFAALLPAPQLAGEICELPYDVFSTAEARAVARPNPLSFLHISKPEIDLPEEIDPYAPVVYDQGQANFNRLIGREALVRFGRPAFYLYRLTMGTHSQLGLVAAASCQDYAQGVIKRHELTRPDKEEDRVRHIRSLRAQTGPALLTYRSVPELDQRCEELSQRPPYVDFTAPDGVRHSSWIIDEQADIQAIAGAFRTIPSLYIADGHHRTAAAARLAQHHDGPGGEDGFLAVIFPHDQLKILPYNRVLGDLNGQTPAELLRRLGKTCLIEESAGAPAPQTHRLGLYMEGRWRALTFRPEMTRQPNPLHNLDVSLLQQHVLRPLLGIDNPRTSERLAFVGGIRGTAELERLVDEGLYACAFSLAPTRIEALMTIADQGEMMPPKSTWFEPKLRDGMFCLELEPIAPPTPKAHSPV